MLPFSATHYHMLLQHRHFGAICCRSHCFLRFVGRRLTSTHLRVESAASGFVSLRRPVRSLHRRGSLGGLTADIYAWGFSGKDIDWGAGGWKTKQGTEWGRWWKKGVMTGSESIMQRYVELKDRKGIMSCWVHIEQRMRVWRWRMQHERHAAEGSADTLTVSLFVFVASSLISNAAFHSSMFGHKANMKL